VGGSSLVALQKFTPMDVLKAFRAYSVPETDAVPDCDCLCFLFLAHLFK